MSNKLSLSGMDQTSSSTDDDVGTETGGNQHIQTYINANFVQGYDGARGAYIAAQGPTPETVNAFWQMVWEQDSRSIVMVTRLHEKGVQKCHWYWPMQLYNPTAHAGDVQYGAVNVAIMGADRQDGYMITKLRVRCSGEQREVWHFWSVNPRLKLSNTRRVRHECSGVLKECCDRWIAHADA